MLPFSFVVPDFAPELKLAIHRTRTLKLGQELGHGSIGRVLEAQCPATQERFALKRVSLPAAADERRTVLQRAAREAAVAQALLSGNGQPGDGLVRHYCCLCDEQEDAVLFVMQLVRGPCLAALKQQEPSKRLQEDRVRRIIAGVARALGRLHSLGILCVDLKAENVVLDPCDQDPNRVVLLDFDLCRDLPGHTRCAAAAVAAAACASLGGSAGQASVETVGVHHSDVDPQPGRIWGTAEYLAYEVLQEGAAAYSPASDWWSLGVLAYELLYGRPPYTGHSLEALRQRMSTFSPAFPSPAEGGPRVSTNMQYFIRSLLRHAPGMRLGSNGGAAEVLSHPALAAAGGQGR